MFKFKIEILLSTNI